MKQIYKYLPYNPMVLWGSDNDAYYKRGEKYELEEILFRTHFTTYSYQEFVEYLVHNNAKPILRPFEDLTKPLPLTKAAAEMVGMKEGEVVNLIIVFTNLLGFLNNTIEIENVTKDRIAVQVYYYNNNPFIEVAPNGTIEKAFDFLRAMLFAVDFKEGEYIKLED